MAREQGKPIERLVLGLNDKRERFRSDVVLSGNESACESNCTGKNGGGMHIEYDVGACAFLSSEEMILGILLNVCIWVVWYVDVEDEDV